MKFLLIIQIWVLPVHALILQIKQANETNIFTNNLSKHIYLI